MLLKKSLFIISSAVALSATSAMAAPAPRIVIAPQCLLNNAQVAYKSLATTPGFQLAEMNAASIEKLAEAKHHSKQSCGGFTDVTRAWTSERTREQNPTAFLKSYTETAKHPAIKSATDVTYKIQYEKETQTLLKTITPQNMWDNLTTLTNFKDRYAGSKNGVKAAEWIKTKIETIAKETGHDDVTVYYVSTGNYSQPSVVAKFGKSNEAGIVVGGHMDTLNSGFENKPGADDDGSGSVTVMETARTILASGMKFEKPIYFIWYSAEEMGLVGSDYVVADFKKKKIPVAAAIQMDMTGYAAENDPTIWLMTDFVSKDLTAFMEKLITTYVKQPYKFSKCGYACSDHASWNKGGVAAAFPFESEMGNDDPYIHTSNDKMDVLSLDHMTDFVKLATSYTVELATPVSK